jgi:hypothetical protein
MNKIVTEFSQRDDIFEDEVVTQMPEQIRRNARNNSQLVNYSKPDVQIDNISDNSNDKSFSRNQNELVNLNSSPSSVSIKQFMALAQSTKAR